MVRHGVGTFSILLFSYPIAWTIGCLGAELFASVAFNGLVTLPGKMRRITTLKTFFGMLFDHIRFLVFIAIMRFSRIKQLRATAANFLIYLYLLLQFLQSPVLE